MTLDTFVIACCTLLSPLLAVQASEWINRSKQRREEKLRIFAVLMATRAANLDPKHVEALNLIDVVFYKKNKKETEIRGKWKAYLDHLTNKSYSPESWASKRVEMFVDLLYEMAKHMDFDMDRTHIKNQCYYPTGHGNLENDQNLIRQGVLSILTGKESLRVKLDSQDNS